MKDLTQGNIYKTFFLFGLPLIFAGVLNQAYAIINSIIAGKFLGEVGLATTGATAPLETFINSLFWGFTAGYAVYIARLFAAKNYQKLKTSFYSCYVVVLIFIVFIGIFLVSLFTPIANLLNIKNNIRSESFSYFAILRIASIFIVLNTLLTSSLNALGISGFPFWMSLLSSLLNIGGNLLSVVVFKLGLKGIAFSSIIANSTIHIFYMIKIKNCFKQLIKDEQKINFDLSTIKEGFPFALPNMLQQGIMYLVGLLISPLVNSMDVSAIASYTVINHIYNFVAAVYQNASKTATNYTAQCIGAKKYGLVKKCIGVALLQYLVLTVPIILICAIFKESVCGLFLKADASSLTKEYCYLFLTIYLPFICFNVVNNLFHGFYRGAKAMGHLFAVSLFGSLTRYVFSAILIPTMGMSGFFLGWIISWIAEAFLTTALFFIGRWQPKEMRQIQ